MLNQSNAIQEESRYDWLVKSELLSSDYIFQGKKKVNITKK